MTTRFLIGQARLSRLWVKAKGLAGERIVTARRVWWHRYRRLRLLRRVGRLEPVRIVLDQRRVARRNLLFNLARGCGGGQHTFGNARVVRRRLRVHLPPVSTISERHEEPERDGADRSARPLADRNGCLRFRMNIEAGRRFDWRHLRCLVGIILWGAVHELSPLSELFSQLPVRAALVRTGGPQCMSVAAPDNWSSRLSRRSRRPRAPGFPGFEFQAASGYTSWRRRRTPGPVGPPPFHPLPGNRSSACLP